MDQSTVIMLLVAFILGLLIAIALLSPRYYR
jgi:hypothetical protein